MLKKLNDWFNQLPELQQLAIIFISNCLLWFIAGFLFNIMLDENENSASRIIFDTTWTATFFTLVFNWKKVTSVFRKRQMADNCSSF